MAQKAQKQRTLLLPHEEPVKALTQSFNASHSLARALSLDRKTVAAGQAAYLQSKAKQVKYVEEARQRPRPPLESVVAQQGMVSDLRRDALDHLPLPCAEKPALREQRLARQEGFLISRQTRHDDACTGFEKQMDSLASNCEEQTQDISNRMRSSVDEAVKRADQVLLPLEKDIDALGEKTEDEVRGIMSVLEGVTADRRALIADFTAELEAVDHSRRERSMDLLRKLADALHTAAHMVPGEIERIVEEKTMDLNSVLLENQKSIKMLTAKLLLHVLEDSKANKVRWRKGLLLWKQMRHRHSVEEVMQRIQSEEYQQPPALVEILSQVREQQKHAFGSRTSLSRTFFATSLPEMTLSNVRTWEEQNTALNDRSEGTFDGLLEDIKTFRDGLDTAAETMMSSLLQELEVHDAKSEWGEHESVGDLIIADIRPSLKQSLDGVRELIAAATGSLSRQEEGQHLIMTQLLLFFNAVARKGQQLEQQVNKFESDYQGEVDDCVSDFEMVRQGDEAKLNGFKDKINDAEHHELLDALKQQAFEHLNDMEQGFRDHSEEVLGIHGRYPQDVAGKVREWTAGLCEELGLALEPLSPAPGEDEDPAEAEAASAAHAEAMAELDGLPEWPGGTGVRLKVLEKTPLAQLRERIMCPPAAAADGAGAEGGADAGAAEGTAEEDDGAPPLLLQDGTPALEALSFSTEWLEESFGTARETVFAQLTASRNRLDKVDIAGSCEEVRRELDQRLRRHTNRKGEVQVEWYVPRHSTIAKHKDKFERHLVEVARKSQGHDEEVDRLYADIDAAERAYKEELEELKRNLEGAENLSALNADERTADDKRQAFHEDCRAKRKLLMDLAKKAPQDLQKGNKAFLAICSGGEEEYSQSEVNYYSLEVEQLNEALSRKAAERMERLQELEQQLDEKAQAPFEAFKKSFDEAEENLCASKGYGKVYGKPRRKAQGLRKTLSTDWTKVKDNMQELIDYLVALCNCQSEKVIDLQSLPPCPQFQSGAVASGMLDKFNDKAAVWENFFSPGDSPAHQSADGQAKEQKQSGSMISSCLQSAEERWVFSSEVIGVLYIAVCSLCAFGTHLGAFKVEPEDRSARYRLASVPTVRVLRENEALCDPEDEEAKAKESELRQGCLEQVMGPLLRRDTFDKEIQKIVADAEDESKQTFKGVVPEFMTRFLEEMKESANEDGLAAACKLRDWSDLLRDTQLLPLGDVLFGELTARAIAELHAGCEATKAKTVGTWANIDGLRAEHEKLLNPRLSNPNFAKELQDLITAEDQRTESALSTAAQDREEMAACLRGLSDALVQRLAATFESVVRLVDVVPLHTHFAPLPGDDQAEMPRVSIKRRMRHVQNETKVDQWGDGLPERKWAGVPRYDLRGALLAGTWPADEELGEKTEEELKELLQEVSPQVDSYRSPLHKRLFDKRGFYYDRYKSEFLAEVKRCDAELTARSEKEASGQRSWQCMVRQLQGGSGSPVGASSTS